ncbi:HU family DNA-binding protein [bacterium]|nr:HU family DNA-binding protein [bacterium]MBU1614404.1 HU family DNA-binding protein [bacterium]
MTKADLINTVAATGLTKRQSAEAIEAVLDGIKDALAGGERVQLVGFGSFEVKERSARSGRNPQTGDAIEIAAKKVPVFKAGTALKDAVN